MKNCTSWVWQEHGGDKVTAILLIWLTIYHVRNASVQVTSNEKLLYSCVKSITLLCAPIFLCHALGANSGGPVLRVRVGPERGGIEALLASNLTTASASTPTGEVVRRASAVFTRFREPGSATGFSSTPPSKSFLWRLSNVCSVGGTNVGIDGSESLPMLEERV